MPGLNVDGPRPAVEWVTSLPGSWTTDRERLVLLLLACDAYGDVSRPGGAALATWAGLINGRLYEVLNALERPNARRPALLARVDEAGELLPVGSRYGGRKRTGYRLRTELDPKGDRPGSGPDDSPGGPGGGDPVTPSEPLGCGGSSAPSFSPATPGENDGTPTLPPRRESSGPELSRETLPGNSPEKLSRETLPAGRETPCPSLPFPSTQASQLRTDRARVVPTDWVEGFTATTTATDPLAPRQSPDQLEAERARQLAALAALDVDGGPTRADA